VRSEVDRLRKRGIDVQTFSIRRPEGQAANDKNVAEHRANTDYILEAGVIRLVSATLRTAIAHPKRFFHSVRLAWQSCAPGLRQLIYQCIYLVEAAYLAEQIRQQQITHLHNHIGENSATVAMLAGCLAEVPYSLTIHGPAIFAAPQRWALGTKLDRAAFTACISSFCRSQCMLVAQPTTWQRLHVVRCAVGDAFLESPNRNASENVLPLILCVGRLCVDKAQALLVEAAAQLATEGERFRLLLVGDGPERATLESQVKEHQLQEVVEITGWQSSDRIKVLLLQARVFALPSFAEGLPIVLMEAMALECPVISTNIAAIGELVEDNGNGWLLTPGEFEPLVNALREALRLPRERLAELGRYGRQCVLERHSPGQQTDQLIELFQANQ
jgi:glycosyltransferase involved in cell wall biosynthesis